MSRIGQTFENLRGEGRLALMPFLVAGDPSLKMTGEFILELEKSGADIIELGVPFSDPLADGPTIQRASQRALAGGVTLTAILEFLKSLRRKTEVPIVLMGYYNPIYHYGVDRFAQDAKASGADGIIVPDLPPEEADALIGASRKVGLDTIFLVAPTSTADRIEKIGAVSRGFIYYVSLAGVTGARKELSSGIAQSVENIRKQSAMPVCVGFGISTPEHVRQVSRYADGAIVGSALVGLIEKCHGDPRWSETVSRFISDLRAATVRSE
ncbi:MAG: tryptophan synthase subunit alpha [bacterium]|nr:tryptophan synthase subunit alpha [bacterium]